MNLVTSRATGECNKLWCPFHVSRTVYYKVFSIGILLNYLSIRLWVPSLVYDILFLNVQSLHSYSIEVSSLFCPFGLLGCNVFPHPSCCLFCGILGVSSPWRCFCSDVNELNVKYVLKLLCKWRVDKSIVS